MYLEARRARAPLDRETPRVFPHNQVFGRPPRLAKHLSRLVTAASASMTAPCDASRLPEGRCLEAGFASYGQPEIDALEADLRTAAATKPKRDTRPIRSCRPGRPAFREPAWPPSGRVGRSAASLWHWPFTLQKLPLAFSRVRRQIAPHEDRRRDYRLDYLLLTPVGGAVFFISPVLEPEEPAASV